MTHALCSLLIPSVSRSLSVSKVSETSLKYSNKSKRLGQDRLSHYRRSFVILFSCPFRVILSLFFVISWKAILQENGSRKEIHRKKRSVKKKCQCAYIACLSLEKQLISKRFLSQNSWTFVMILPLFPKSSPWRETWVCLWHRVVSLDRLFMTCFSTTKDHLREIILFWEKRHKRVNLAADSLEDTHDSEDMILFQSLLYETPERKDHLKNLTRTAWSVFNEVFSGMSSLWYVVSSVCTCLWRCFRGWCLRPVLQCHSYFLVLLAMTHDPLVLCVFNWCWLSCVSNCDLSVDRIAPARQAKSHSQFIVCLPVRFAGKTTWSWKASVMRLLLLDEQDESPKGDTYRPMYSTEDKEKTFLESFKNWWLAFTDVSFDTLSWKRLPISWMSRCYFWI